MKLKFLILFLLSLFTSYSNAGVNKGQSNALFDLITYFSNDASLDSVWDATSFSSFTLSGNTVMAWAPTYGTRTATPVSTGPTYSASALNNLPGVIFSGNISERLGFSATGLPNGNSKSTLIVVASSTSSNAFNSVFGYGGGFANFDSRLIGAYNQSSCICAGASIIGYNAITPSYTWQNNTRIVITEFSDTSVLGINIDGDANIPSFQQNGVMATALNKGRIGASTADNSPWIGVVQYAAIIKRNLTTLEKDKVSSFLAFKFNISANLASSNPYKTTQPTYSATISSDLLSGMNVVWYDNFNNLSLRTGNYWSGDNTGYNDPNAKGTWSVNGFSYMTSAQGYPGFGWDVFVNPFYNWQALDPTFPPFGTIDITTSGLVLFGTQNYPAVRNSFTATADGPPFLGSLVTTMQSAKLAAPFAMRIRYSINKPSSCYNFPAGWALGAGRYNVTSPTIPHQEWDFFEQFGCETNDNVNQQHTHITVSGSMISDGVAFNTGTNINGNSTFETLAIVNSTNTYFYTNGVPTSKITNPVGWITSDLIAAVLNYSVGMSFECYPGKFSGAISGTTLTVSDISGCHVEIKSDGTQTITGSGIASNTIITGAITGTGRTGTYTVNNSQNVSTENMFVTPALSFDPYMIVRSVEFLAPPSNNTGIFPPASPTPVLTWSACCLNGNIPVSTVSGTTVATLSGASTFSFIPYLSTFNSLTVSGNNLITVGSLSKSSQSFYIRGVDADGTPGIAPKLNLRIQ